MFFLRSFLLFFVGVIGIAVFIILLFIFGVIELGDKVIQFGKSIINE